MVVLQDRERQKRSDIYIYRERESPRISCIVERRDVWSLGQYDPSKPLICSIKLKTNL